MTGRAEIVTSLAGIDEIEREWRRLAELRGNAFVTPEWYRACLRNYSGGDPWAVVCRDLQGRVAGVLPFLRQRRSGLAVLRFAGAGLGDIFHPATPDDADEGIASAAAVALAEARHEWDAIALDRVPSGEGWVHALARGIPGTACSFGPPETLPFIRLAGLSWERYLAQRSPNLRAQLGRKLRKLERESEVDIRQPTTPEELQRDLGDCFRLHDLRWAGRGGSSLAGAAARRAHAEFAAAALRAGWLRLSVLDVDGAPAAALYGWRLGSRYSYYLAGFDPARSQAGVGLLLLAHTIRAAIDEAADEYDLLLGDEPYKRRFAEPGSARYVRTAVIAPRASVARVLLSAELRLRVAARRLPDPLGRTLRRALRPGTRRLPLARGT